MSLHGPVAGVLERPGQQVEVVVQAPLNAGISVTLTLAGELSAVAGTDISGQRP